MCQRCDRLETSLATARTEIDSLVRDLANSRLKIAQEVKAKTSAEAAAGMANQAKDMLIRRLDMAKEEIKQLQARVAVLEASDNIWD